MSRARALLGAGFSIAMYANAGGAQAATPPDACVGNQYQLNIRPIDTLMLLNLHQGIVPIFSRAKTFSTYPTLYASTSTCTAGRIKAADLGVVINTNDPYSVAVGNYYIQQRNLNPNNVLRVAIPIKPELTRTEFADLATSINNFFGSKVQALALVWQQPFAVEVLGDVSNGVHFNCNTSITSAVTLGYNPNISCPEVGTVNHSYTDPNPAITGLDSPYYSSSSTRPYTDFNMRLSMLLAANTVDQAKALIDRGIQSDGTLGLPASPKAKAHFLITSDAGRSVRQYWFPPAGLDDGSQIKFFVDHADSLVNEDKVLFYMAGTFTVANLDTVKFLPGALADHLTSYGGILLSLDGVQNKTIDSQMNVLAWIAAGATATYGSTSEPRGFPRKFPMPTELVPFYVQGATAIEAYWKSVKTPQQGLFVGEPLAAPFAR
jgi:uncharacterized protein (TIGR03790 family)